MGSVVAGIIAIVALGLAYLSFKTWRITSVIFVVLICLGAAVNVYLAAMTLKVHDAWRKRVRDDMAEVQKLDKEYAVLLDGEEEKEQQLAQGIKQVKAELYRIAVDRGGVYYNVELTKIDVQTGAVTAKIAAPTPHGLAAKQVVFAFDQAPLQGGGHYMGEFKVAATVDMTPDVELAPNVPFSANDLKRVTASKGPWILYLTMPLDNPAVAASVPADVRQAVAANVSADFFEPNRKLHDYEFAYHEYQVQVPLLVEDIGREKADIEKRIIPSQQQAQKEVDYREAEKTSLQGDLARFKNERDVVTKYEQTLDGKLAAVRGTIRGVYFENKQLAEELTTLQLKAVDEINRRTGVAQAAAPGPAGGAFTGQP